MQDSHKGRIMFIRRDLTSTLLRFAGFPVVALLGPRQSGKTTLARETFKKHTFLSFEIPSVRAFAENDPERFLSQNENEYGVIIDEFQYVPQLLSYIQLEVDQKKRPGYFVLTGSQNFLMNQAITQSLAGRVGILNLLPLSLHELKDNGFLDSADSAILQGGYPRIFAENLSPLDFYPSYIQSYIERDIRQLINVGQITVFHKFMQLCAGRIGQLLNITDLATTIGVNQRVIQQWLSMLEATYIIFLLRPHFKNFNKRITKSPKIFFYDTGIACSLLEIRSTTNLSLSPFRGHLFENLMIADFHKQYSNLGIRPPLYFWRDLNGRIEVDCIIDAGIKLIPIEIKSAQTIVPDFFYGLEQWNAIAHANPEDGYLVYGGSEVQARRVGNVIGWQSATNFIQKIEKD